jgi:hypothetical protein
MEILSPKTDYLAVSGRAGRARRPIGVCAAAAFPYASGIEMVGLLPFWYLQEFLAIQNQQPRNLGFFGTRNMGFMHQQLIEVLSYAMLLTVSAAPLGPDFL